MMREGENDLPASSDSKQVKTHYQVIEFAKQADQTVKRFAESLVKAKADLRKGGIDTIAST